MKQRVLLTTIVCAFAVASIAAQVVSQLSEQEVSSRVSRTRADLRSLHTAIESYKVDWNYYPSSLVAITTPISYITGFVADPFEARLPEGVPVPEHLTPPGGMFGEPGILKMGVVMPDSQDQEARFVIYGVGPDGKDDRGALEYDPTNGTLSSGDIVRLVSSEEVPFVYFDTSIQKEVADLMAKQNAIRSAIISYSVIQKEFPQTLNQLTTPVAYLASVPDDPFLPGLPIGYRIEGEGETGKALIYSVGPDLDDDNAEKRLMISSPTASLEDGDIITVVDWSTIQTQLQPFRDDTSYKDGVNPWKEELLKWQEQNEGKDNAFLWYKEAASVTPGMPSQQQADAMESLLNGE